MINTNSQAKCLIFKNLPFELECIILNHYRELRSNAWHNVLRMFSTRKLVRELYKQAQDQDHDTDAFGDCRPRAYKREIFRLYKLYLADYDETINSKQTFSQTEGHSMINMSFALNDNLKDRIIRINYVSPSDVITGLDDYLPFKNEAVQDFFDQQLIGYWVNVGINKKEAIVRHYFGEIKEDCIKNYGLINVESLNCHINESAYRILRFAFINDSEWFK